MGYVFGFYYYFLIIWRIYSLTINYYYKMYLLESTFGILQESTFICLGILWYNFRNLCFFLLLNFFLNLRFLSYILHDLLIWYPLELYFYTLPLGGLYKIIFWKSLHLEVTSDTFCFLINSSWLLIFGIVIISFIFIGFNIYCWTGIHFS